MVKRHGQMRSAAQAVERTALLKMLPFVGPHVLPAVVLALGALFHHLWADTAYGPGIAPTVILAVFMGLSFATWTYAAPRQAIQRMHATGTVAVVGLFFYVLQVFGVGTATIEFVLIGGFALAVSWNIRRLEVIAGEGKDDHGAKEEPDWHGLKRPRRWKIEESPDRTVVQATLAPGQTAKDALNAAPGIGSEVGAIYEGVRVLPGERMGDAEIQIYWEDLSKRTYPWEGPKHADESIALPIPLGLNESGELVHLYVMGDDVAGIAKGNLKVGGVTRSGKGVLVMILMCEVRSRCDVFPMISDHSKGEQMLGLLRPGLTRENSWIATNDAELLGQLKSIKAAIRERNIALGKCGYSSWEPACFTDPRLRMPAIAWFIEEFGSCALLRQPSAITQVGNECLSAGIFICASMQRFSYDQVPTSFRSAFSQGICFGVEDDQDAKFVLPDETLATGVSPGGWNVRYPGRAMCALNGASDKANQTPFRSFFGMSKHEFEGMVRASMAAFRESGPKLDPVTRAAFGDAYAAWQSGSDPVSSPVSDPVSSPVSGPVSSPVSDPVSSPVSGIRTVTPSYDPTTIEEDRGEEMDAERDPDFDDPTSELYLSRPRTPDPELFDEIDPREDIKPSGMPEIDMTEPDMPGVVKRVLSKKEKRELFASILLGNSGEEMSTAEFVLQWRNALGLPEANRDPAVSQLITEACESGALERLGRGRFQVPVPVGNGA
ncbi:MAG TPA: hypothetical protein VLT90_12995 [Terriglobales bacterium]|nr:hypothetical protein [Terriglobales bacterium]